MDTIGFSIGDMIALMVSLKVAGLKEQEETTRSTAASFVSDGCSEDEAQFRAGMIANLSVDTSAILGIIDVNNKRILSDLKQAGLLSP